MASDLGAGETMVLAEVGEGHGLLVGPAVTGVAAGSWLGSPFDGH
jgi:hypothetical protein